MLHRICQRDSSFDGQTKKEKEKKKKKKKKKEFIGEACGAKGRNLLLRKEARKEGNECSKL